MSSEASEDSAPPRLEGGFVGVRDHGIVGWAWDAERPHRTLELEFSIDGKPAGSARAELFETELAERRLGNGSHSFRFRLDQIPALPCEITATVAGAETSFGPLRLTSVQELERALEPSVRYHGQVDEFLRSKGRIHGWVYDRLHPSARVRVTLRDWDEPLAEVRADIHRPGLEEDGRGDGSCAFAVRLPVSLLDGRSHTLRITVEDTDVELPGSPIAFEPEMARELMEVIAPWRADVARIESALVRLDQLIERLDAEQARPSLSARLTSLLERSMLKDRIKELIKR